MNYRQMAGAIVALVMMCGAAGAQDGPPTDYAEQTVTFGFHNRGSNHWAGAVSAACAGLTGLQNPLNDKVDPAQPAPDLRVTIEGTKIPWNFPSDAVFELRVTEIRTVRGPIKLTLFNKDGSRINDATGKPVELTKAGDSYSAYDDNGLQVRPFVARIQADAETKADAKGNAGGHAILTAKVKPHVDFTFSNPVKDLTSVQIQVRVYPETATLTGITSFTIKRQRERWQNEIGRTTSIIEKVNPADLTRWQIPAAYWYGDPATGDLCLLFQAPYQLDLQAQFTLNGQIHNGTAKRTLLVALPQYPDWTRAAFRAARPGLIPNTLPVQRADGAWTTTLTIPENIFGKQGRAVNVDQSQYRDLITKEEKFHVKQWLGEVPREKGGCAALYSRNSVEYYLENKNPDYDGKTVLTAPTKNALEFEMAQLRTTAVRNAEKESDRLIELARGFREKKAKEEVGFKEAYTYACTYQQKWGENPENPDTPWKE